MLPLWSLKQQEDRNASFWGTVNSYSNNNSAEHFLLCHPVTPRLEVFFLSHVQTLLSSLPFGLPKASTWIQKKWQYHLGMKKKFRVKWQPRVSWHKWDRFLYNGWILSDHWAGNTANSVWSVFLSLCFWSFFLPIPLLCLILCLENDMQFKTMTVQDSVFMDHLCLSP